MKKGNEVATIDVAMVTIETVGGTELALDTANKVDVSVASETTDAVKNIVKGKLIAQKPATTTVTGNAITMTDNVFNADLVKILQGGIITFWGDAAHSTRTDTDMGYGVAGYTPPVIGSSEKGEIFRLNLYSAIYNAAGIITGYEKCSYPNCQGQPVAFGAEDGTFRAPSYTINSAPDKGEAPYELNYVDALPSFDSYTVTQNLTHATSSYTEATVTAGERLVVTLTAESGYELATPTVTMGGTTLSGAWDATTRKITIPSVTGAVVITETATEE